MKFSVIVPVYNVKPYLRVCLDSVLAQTCADWECVCVDDGSTDGSAAILDEYGAKDARFRVIHKKNEGVAIARNTALDVIKGEWFLFLDSDDIWSPSLLSTCKNLCSATPDIDVVRFKYKCFHQDGHCFLDDIKSTDGVLVDFTGVVSLSQTRFAAFDKAYRRSTLGHVRQDWLCMGEDLYYMARCVLIARRMVVCDSLLYGYRTRDMSAKQSPMTYKKAFDSLMCVYGMYSLFEKSSRKFDRWTRRWIGVSLFENAIWSGMQLHGKERSLYFDEWHRYLLKIKRNGFLLPFDEFRLQINRSIPFRIVSWATCYLPEWLKRKGVHR